MRTWVIGDSIINRAGKDQVQIHGGGKVLWNGLSGAHCVDLVGRVTRLMNNRRRAAPTTLIIHVGTNDIFTHPTWEIRRRVEENLTGLRALLPNTRLIWSDILLRLGYPEEEIDGAGKRNMRNINKWAHKICREKLGENAYVIVHSGVFASHLRNLHGRPIYKYDCTHPSDFGLLLFRQNLSNALVHFNNQPNSKHYPPGALRIMPNE